MPFKYTDEKNSVYLEGIFIWKKSKYSAAFKLMIIHESETSGTIRTSRKYSLSDRTIRTH